VAALMTPFATSFSPRNTDIPMSTVKKQADLFYALTRQGHACVALDQLPAEIPRLNPSVNTSTE